MRRRGIIFGALALIVVSSLTTWGFLMVSPKGAAQVERSLLTEPVQQQVLVSSIITRGAVTTLGNSQIGCYPSGSGSEAKVFTRPPVLGQKLAEGDVLAGVNGRPVLLLAGKFNSYRGMLPGTSGDDVAQLQAGLRRIGYRIADKKGFFGKDTQNAVRQWYSDNGFVAQNPDSGEAASLRAGKNAVSQAETELANANAALKKAKKGASKAEKLSAQLSVAQAERRVKEAKGVDKAIAAKELTIAKILYKELTHPDLTEFKASVTAAAKSLKQARTDYAELSRAIGVSVPYCEVVFVPSMPVSVTQIGAAAATEFDAAKDLESWVSVASGDLTLQAEIDAADQELISEGMEVSFSRDGDSTERTGKIAYSKESLTAGKFTLTITPDEPFTIEEEGQNLRVKIEVATTTAQVLVVPISAVSATASGDARITKLVDGELKEVKVVAGLTADGFVEVTPMEAGTLAPGDSVVVGR